ncbi:hypothetical protein HUJ04_008308 [Dendroctonus ponderosae]|nr:hypothetical protein HUJ04_008308 [Dendroctonus ponderosae]
MDPSQHIRDQRTTKTVGFFRETCSKEVYVAYYSELLDRFYVDLKLKRGEKSAVLSGQCTCEVAMAKIHKLGHELLPHPAYSPGLAPCDYFLFKNLKKWLGRQYDLRCPVCGKGFQCRSYLMVHQRVHSDVKPFPCSTCGLNFKTKQSLLDHTNRHLGLKPYTCTVCKRGFITKNPLVCLFRLVNVVDSLVIWMSNYPSIFSVVFRWVFYQLDLGRCATILAILSGCILSTWSRQHLLRFRPHLITSSTLQVYALLTKRHIQA